MRKSLGFTYMLACALLAAAPVRSATAATRPLSDFLSAQGTTTILDPPIPDYVGWFSDPVRPPTRGALVDYAGIEAKWVRDHGGPWMGTEVSGTVLERPLDDGRAEVTVTLHTVNAQTWIIPLDLNGDIITQVQTNPVFFGYRGTELVANPTLSPALSECNLVVVFKNTGPGASLPDLVNAFILGNAAPGQELVSFSIRATGSGPLHASFGVAEGTPGEAVVVQTQLFMTSFKGALADGAPAELVDLHARGH